MLGKATNGSQVCYQLWGSYEVAISNTAQKIQEIMADGYCSAGCSTKKMMRRDSGQCTLTSHVLCIHASPCCCKRKKRAVFHFCLPDLTRRNSCYCNLNQSPTTKDSQKFVSQTSTLKLQQRVQKVVKMVLTTNKHSGTIILLSTNQYIASYSTVSPRQQWQ